MQIRLYFLVVVVGVGVVKGRAREGSSILVKIKRFWGRGTHPFVEHMLCWISS